MKPQSEKILSYDALFEEQPDSGYTVTVPMLPGCISEGDTYEDARKNIAEAIQLYLEDLAMDGEDIPDNNRQTFVSRVGVAQPHNFPQ